MQGCRIEEIMIKELKLFDNASPGCGRELILKRKKALVNIYSENGVEVVGSLHLSSKAYDNDKLGIGEILSESVEKLVGNLGGILYDLLSELLKKLFLLIKYKIVGIKSELLKIAYEEK